MKRWMFALGMLVLPFGFFAGSASAVTFAPDPADLKDLDHYYAYMWEVDWAPAPGETIVSAKLTFHDIWDWTRETDILRVWLLDHVPETPTGWTSIGTDTWQKKDDQKTSFPNFPDPKVIVGTWSDPYGGEGGAHKIDLIFNFAPGSALLDSLIGYIGNDGEFGFGIDPDCHYYNTGIDFEIVTRPVPEPASMILLGSGLLGLAGYGRRKVRGEDKM